MSIRPCIIAAMQGLLFPPDAEPQQPVVLSYGMGVDSTALLLRWLYEPDSRDFDLQSLVALTAQTGSEFRDTQQLVESHVLPLLRAFRIRYVQIGRTGPSQAEGLTVLEDSREPTRLHVEGAYTLAQELLTNGTVPQVATGQRRCTAHFKGFPLTAWTDREFGEQTVRKVIGYNADEVFRAQRSEGYATDERPIEYPLIQWQWGRDQCEAYVRRITGQTWRKSLCTFCCFSGGKPDVLARYRESPEEAAEALFIEFVSLAFNPRAPLYGKKSLHAVLAADGNSRALGLLQERLSAVAWAVYRVRRIVWAKGRADRKTQRESLGDRARVTAGVLLQGGQMDGEVPRLQIRQRAQTYPTLEEMLIGAPAVVADKCRPKFDENWARLTGTKLFG